MKRTVIITKKNTIRTMSGKLTVDDFLSAMERFDKAHIEPVQKVFIVPPAYYDEAKKLFDGTDVKVMKNQSIDPKVYGYLMDEETAETMKETIYE